METAACTCIICSDAEPGREPGVVRHVRETGWSVLIVGGEMEFAYTIGLWHTFRRPEVVMFGLEGEGMHYWLNTCVERGRERGWPAEGEEFAGVLDGFPVQLRPVHVSWHDALFGAAWRFYQQTAVPVLQLVWPDSNGVWPWQEGATASSRTRQAFAWRPVSKHPRGGWRRYGEKERERHIPRLDALTSRGLLEGNRPVTRIVHHQGRYDVLDPSPQTRCLSLACLTARPPSSARTASGPLLI
jgi:hypothetical protein